MSLTQYDPRVIAKANTGTFFGKLNAKGSITFGGVPYAKYRGRWQVLSELPRSEKVVETFKSGPQCPQNPMPFGMLPPNSKDMPEAKPQSEDCCTLCIASPDLNGKLPVYL
jgi:carboxylesterase type B